MSQISPQKPPISSNSVNNRNFVQHHLPWLYAFWKFSRPHTVIGTSLSVVGLFLIALSTRQVSEPVHLESFSSALLPTLLACLSGNVYIVGLNQLEDVAIDRINKPHLPIASGEFSRRQGQAIVAIAGGFALLLAVLQGQFLLGTVCLSMLIGTAYSLPPLRLKRFPFWASLCIFSVRGAIVNLGLFLHFQQGTRYIPPIVWALTGFILLFTFAIAIFKDIPDLEGDRRYHIRTLTIRLGQQTVFNLARWVLTVSYLGMIVGGFWLPSVNHVFLVGSHLFGLLALWYYSFRVDFQDQGGLRQLAGETLSYTQFYQFIWKLFFLEYLIFSIACLLK